MSEMGGNNRQCDFKGCDRPVRIVDLCIVHWFRTSDKEELRAHLSDFFRPEYHHLADKWLKDV